LCSLRSRARFARRPPPYAPVLPVHGLDEHAERQEVAGGQPGQQFQHVSFREDPRRLINLLLDCFELAEVKGNGHPRGSEGEEQIHHPVRAAHLTGRSELNDSREVSERLDDDPHEEGYDQPQHAFHSQPVQEVAPHQLLQQVQHVIAHRVREEQPLVRRDEQGRADAPHEQQECAVDQHADVPAWTERAPERVSCENELWRSADRLAICNHGYCSRSVLFALASLAGTSAPHEQQERAVDQIHTYMTVRLLPSSGR
jgi:hypothetical protein